MIVTAKRKSQIILYNIIFINIIVECVWSFNTGGHNYRLLNASIANINYRACVYWGVQSNMRTKFLNSFNNIT